MMNGTQGNQKQRLHVKTTVVEEVAMKKQLVKVIAAFAFLMLATPMQISALEVGDKAPTFSAVSTAGDIALTDYAGKQHVVLALYFAVFTPV